MKKKRKKERDWRFDIEDGCILAGVLAGLLFGIVYFARNPQEAAVAGRFGGSSSGKVGGVCATGYYMLLGGALGKLAHMGYERWRKKE